uniref:Uncharacterized protein LOC100181880 n=1 Tax=Phallusia mammillata TaxID=59560 RepID=A0A6F9DH03_9ASCI|nr:uncharacterized protein LOC100181880 [Phallusia mammillata]
MGVLKEGQPLHIAPKQVGNKTDEVPFQHRSRQNKSRRGRQRLVRMSDKENDINDALTSLKYKDDAIDDKFQGSPSKAKPDFPVYENILFSEACVAARECHQETSKEQQNNECYYDINLAQKCHKLLHQQAGKCPSTRVMLFPEEEWAKNAPGIQWSIKMNRWWKRYCTVTEMRAGGRRVISSLGKVTQNRDGTLTIAGHFKRNKDPDFRLHLSARVTKDDFERGYVMTGALQLGDLKGEGRMEITHFAVVPRYQTEEKSD